MAPARSSARNCCWARPFLGGQGLMTLMGKGYLTAAHREKEIDATVEACQELMKSIESD